MQQIRNEAYDVLLTDLRLPDLGEQEELFGGLKLSEFAKQTDSSIEVIIITGYASRFILIKQAIANAISKRSLKVERDRLNLPLKWSRYKPNIKNWVHVKRKCKAKRSRVLYKHSVSVARFLNMSQLCNRNSLTSQLHLM